MTPVQSSGHCASAPVANVPDVRNLPPEIANCKLDHSLQSQIQPCFGAISRQEFCFPMAGLVTASEMRKPCYKLLHLRWS